MKCSHEMSEFKYACPVCGQHIKCDSSQAGTRMQCPTCFQDIIVPQAPSGEQKLILTGTKANDRSAPKTSRVHLHAHTPAQRFSGVAAVFIILICIATAITFVYHGTIFKKPSPLPPATDSAAPDGNSSTNWALNLQGFLIPVSPAAGRVYGQDFVCKRAVLFNGNLTLHDGDLSVTINFNGSAPETLSEQQFTITTNTANAARVTLRWKNDGQTQRRFFTNDYAMLLNFHDVTNNHLSGDIYLCTTDDQKSYLAGTFRAEIRKAKLWNP